MKNLKKVLALVVALTMVLGTVSFAFTDVDVENDAYTAVQTLSALNILNGYEDGTFGPEKDITRAEFAAVVCRALNMEGSANGSKGATPFTDVPADHWASGYINLAAGQGIVNGYGDGKFGPEDNVTYEQAVKMLVVALGFEPMAAQKGGFPTGYLVIANQYGMTKDVSVSGDSAAANRGVVAQLTYNALDIPMMEQTGFGTNTEYTIQDGKNLRDYKTLLVGLDVAKRDGVVVGTPVINNTGVKAGQVNFKVSVGGVYGEAITGLGEGASKVLDLAEGVNVEDFFGLASTIYLKEVKTNKYEVIAIMAGEVTEIVELTKDDFAAPIVTNSGKAIELKYYESETATKETTLKLDSLVGGSVANDVIYNNAADTVANIDLWAVDTVITVINNDDDSAYDMIIAKNYAYDIVEEVEADRNRFSTKGAYTFKFDFEDEEKINTIVDKDGNAITLADFAEGDVVAYITAGNVKNEPVWCDIINLGQNVVTGTVTETNSNDNTVSVDGVAYKLASGVSSINVSDEGTFFLTANGKIFDKDTTASVSSNFAYVLEAGYGSTGAFGQGWQIRLLTKEGNIQIFDMKDTFEVEVNSGADFVGTKYAATASGSTQAYNSSNPVELANIASDGANHKANYANRLVTYKLDSNNAIKELRFISGASFVSNIVAPAEFKAAAQTINRKVIADEAVIFNIDASDMDATKVGTVGSLVDETLYTGLLAKVDATETEYNCFVVVTGASAIDYTQPIAIVDATSTGVDADGEDVTKVTYFTANDETAKVLEINDDTNFVAGSESDLKKGTLVMFAADANGVATDVAVIAKSAVVSSSGEKYVANSDGVSAVITAEDEVEFVFGYMDDWRTGNGRVVTYVGDRYYWNTASVAKAAAETNDIVLTGDVNAYTVVNNTNASRAYIAVADWQADADIDKDDTTNASYFVAKLVDGVVADIVVLGDRAAK